MVQAISPSAYPRPLKSVTPSASSQKNLASSAVFKGPFAIRADLPTETVCNTSRPLDNCIFLRENRSGKGEGYVRPNPGFQCYRIEETFQFLTNRFSQTFLFL